jgi:hypothetical protein
MIRHIRTISMLSATVLIGALLSSTAAASPFIGKPIHAPYPVTPPVSGSSSTASGSSNTSNTSSTASTGSATSPPKHPVTTGHSGSNTSSNSSSTTTPQPAKPRLKAPQLKICQNHTTTITTLMTRADTRAQNQITLFTAVASKVENFYTSKGKTIATYSQLVAVVNADETQATTDLATLKANSTFSCDSSDPGGAVSTYRTDLQAVQTDTGNLRTAVKNLIMGVAQAEGYTLPEPSNSGGQQ